MKISNKKLKRLVKFFNLFLFVVLLTTLSIAFGWIKIQLPFNHYFIILIPVLIISYIATQGLQYFELDTCGEGITLTVQRIDLLSFLGMKEKKVDLPKYKLNNYQFRRGIFNDDLVLFINSRKSKSNVVKVKLRLSFLSNNTRNKIIAELDNIISKNQYQLENKIA